MGMAFGFAVLMERELIAGFQFAARCQPYPVHQGLGYHY